MTPDDVKQAVVEILREVAPDEAVACLDPDVPFREQLDIDSMDFLDLVLALRKRYRIDIPESDYALLLSLNASVSYLINRLADR